MSGFKPPKRRREADVEWRVFFVPREDQESAFVHPKLEGSSVETRTDMYVPVSSATGVKKRDGTRWELKRRSKTVDGMEVWSKKLIQESDLERVIAEDRAEPDLSAYRLDVAKRRRRVVLSRGVCVMEQTELEISLQGGGDGRTETWRTVSIEGKADSVSEQREAILETCHAHGTHLAISGYPEYAVAAAARLAQAQE